ncbi:RNA polymerase sigma factor [candidate division KSB1 bacterium]|nr:RNA polymerase sigma factor [candidate division KSB1 bacterium]
MTDSIDIELADLLISAQQGDTRACNQLCIKIEGIMRGYFRNKFQDNEIVDELSQETYVRLLNNITSIREPMKLRGFVAKIAIHVSQDYLRSKYKRKQDSVDSYISDTSEFSHVPDDGHIAKEPADQILDSIDIDRALRQLPEKSRHILLMKADGYKYEEIASEMGLSVSGVKMQVQRSLESLRADIFYVTFLCIYSTILLEQLLNKH